MESIRPALFLSGKPVSYEENTHDTTCMSLDLAEDVPRTGRYGATFRVSVEGNGIRQVQTGRTSFVYQTLDPLCGLFDVLHTYVRGFSDAFVFDAAERPNKRAQLLECFTALQHTVEREFKRLEVDYAAASDPAPVSATELAA